MTNCSFYFQSYDIRSYLLLYYTLCKHKYAQTHRHSLHAYSQKTKENLPQWRRMSWKQGNYQSITCMKPAWVWSPGKEAQKEQVAGLCSLLPYHTGQHMASNRADARVEEAHSNPWARSFVLMGQKSASLPCQDATGTWDGGTLIAALVHSLVSKRGLSPSTSLYVRGLGLQALWLQPWDIKASGVHRSTQWVKLPCRSY